MSPTGYAAYHRRRAEEDALLGPTLSETLTELWQQKRAEVEDRSRSFMDWSLKIPEPKTGTLDFKRFPFQVELYEECATHPEVVITKSTQVGISAYLVRWTMYAADVLGLTALYVFPKRAQLLDFSDARVRPLILNSEHLRSRVPTAHVSNKSHKQVGLGRVLYRGSQSADDLQSADADVLALDEYDDLVVEHIPDAERRLTGSQVGWVRRVGVPSDPEYGLDKLYLESDRRRWFVRCAACRDRQPITFYDNVDQEALRIICARCGKPLDVTQGEWVAEFPDRSIRGYHIPRLIVPDTDLGKIVKASRAREPYKVKVFHNKDLGEAWAPEEGRLSKEALAAAERTYTMSEGFVGSDLVTMGVDVASARALNVRISLHTDERTKGALWIGEVDSFDDLATKMDLYCLDPATRVLYGDLSWRRIGDAVKGDRIIGFDEQTEGKTRRKLRTATVEGVTRRRTPCYRVTFEDGRQIVASAEHFWLAGKVGPRQGYTRDLPPGVTDRRWIATKDLRPGTHIRDIGAPWKMDTSRDGGYLAGVFDGEGCLRGGPGWVVAFAQKPGVVLDRVQALLEAKGFRPTQPCVHDNGCASMTVRSAYDTMRFLGACRPERLLRKVPEWIEGRQPGSGTGAVVSVDFLGDREVVAVGTSTKTLIAEGFLSHNSVKMCAIDHMPEHRLARAFAERFAGRVYLARYTGTQVQKVFDVDEEMRTVTVRRTEAIDAAMEMVRSQRNHLPLDRPDNYNAQMMAALRFVDQDELGRTVVGYRSTSPDDYLHAETYDVIATELWYFRQHVDAAQRDVFSTLEDHMEFRRSGLGDYGDPDRPDIYLPGPDEDYNPGYEPDR